MKSRKSGRKSLFGLLSEEFRQSISKSEIDLDGNKTIFNTLSLIILENGQVPGLRLRIDVHERYVIYPCTLELELAYAYDVELG